MTNSMCVVALSAVMILCSLAGIDVVNSKFKALKAQLDEHDHLFEPRLRELELIQDRQVFLLSRQIKECSR